MPTIFSFVSIEIFKIAKIDLLQATMEIFIPLATVLNGIDTKQASFVSINHIHIFFVKVTQLVNGNQFLVVGIRTHL